MRVFLTNVGCKLNQAELEHLARGLVAAGHEIAPSLAGADLHVVNSCSVTQRAARDSRKLARRGRRAQPGIKTVLTGCFVDGAPDEAARIAGVDLVVPHADKERLFELLTRTFVPDPQPRTAPGSEPPRLEPGFGNTRPLVKIEDGCNMRCAFCIIPTTRGRQRSRPLPEVVAEVDALAASGAREVVITGVQISSYRWRGSGLFELVERVLAGSSIPRLRLSSIAPWQFDRRLLELLPSGRLCRHFHLSLQSGCDRTLERMRRPYTVRRFARLLAEIRDQDEDIAVTTDVIVGFPGESEAEFAASRDRVAAGGFARIHVFPFSPRPGTEAAAMPAQVPHPIRQRRMRSMLALAERSADDFVDHRLGRVVEVLWERRREGRWIGMADNYIRVTTTAPQRVNTLTRVVLRGRRGGLAEAAPDFTLSAATPNRVSAPPEPTRATAEGTLS